MSKTILSLATATALAVITLSAATATAQTPAAKADPIVQRKAILKGFGAATGPAVQIMQGKAPFDAAKVQAALATYQKGAATLPSLFPANSMTGGKTEAKPEIWQNKADFNGRFAKLAADAKLASAAITDEASFKANFPKVLTNCGGCHDLYRVKK